MWRGSVWINSYPKKQTKPVKTIDKKKTKCIVITVTSVFIGIAVIGFGITLSVIANVVLNCGEALVKAIADTWELNFGNVKI